MKNKGKNRGALRLALFAFLFPCLSSAQGIQQWRFFGPEKGMGMGFQKIIQDHYGFIWCASSNGLYRYDGQEFKAFKKYVTHDNPLSSDFIWDILEDEQHNIWLATYDGGVNKWEKTIREVPDIIISDIMMPEMDGLELCKRLKADLKTSHIPVLLLSARADALSRAQGFETGADAYLAKPFSKRELLAQLQQLADNRKRLQDHYQANLQNKALPNKAPEELGREEAFLLQAHQVVISQLPNADFGPKELCKALQMSKTQLHNKLTALTGRSTALFIRGIRLQYARQALEQTPGLTVKQAAYDAGFKDPNYFSRCFKKEFGMSPKEVRP